MKKILFCILFVCLAPMAAQAQLSIDEVETPRERLAYRDTVRRSDPRAEYFSAARYRAEREQRG